MSPSLLACLLAHTRAHQLEHSRLLSNVVPKEPHCTYMTTFRRPIITQQVTPWIDAAEAVPLGLH
ncbi:unnamed protein product [Periconia digitata]|uniref:Uncharacterized protein n=1 Tax=Periconia digitata TaxID=1303443 RepID=A0A9W4XRN4_9PLEO|nr:unnamed protein product [Periconia digitata]